MINDCNQLTNYKSKKLACHWTKWLKIPEPADSPVIIMIQEKCCTVAGICEYVNVDIIWVVWFGFMTWQSHVYTFWTDTHTQYIIIIWRNAVMISGDHIYSTHYDISQVNIRSSSPHDIILCARNLLCAGFSALGLRVEPYDFNRKFYEKIENLLQEIAQFAKKISDLLWKWKNSLRNMLFCRFIVETAFTVIFTGFLMNLV